MAENRGNGARAQTHGLPGEAEWDMRELLCSEELPAQWQGYPLKTQQELMRGRKSLTEHRIHIWADEAEAWLRTVFAGKGLEFHTGWDAKDHTLTLRVFHDRVASDGSTRVELIFEVTEPADVFITPTTLTKIILLAG